VVDAILSGTHEPSTSHYDLLLAFIDDTTLRRVDQELNTQNYRTHEFGDSIFIERGAEKYSRQNATSMIQATGQTCGSRPKYPRCCHDMLTDPNGAKLSWLCDDCDFE